MNSTSLISKCSFVLAITVLVLWAPLAEAQQSLSVTVTPPLVQLTIGPGETWNSTLKIVNTNPYDVTYYTTPVDFEAQGEEGKGTFVPLVEGATGANHTHSLGSWIEITRDPIVVPQGTSRDVRYTVRVPEDAEPGGHYAAILVGTSPSDVQILGPTVKVSSFVSALVFVRIRGDVIETGRIREFRTDHSFYQSPEAQFSVRFENTGTTHLRPQGDITIYNMWGKERGHLTLASQTAFGNVLPNSIRKFTFTWNGEARGLDIGRYKAIAVLSYGDEVRQTTTATTYFWVVPIVPVSIALGALAIFILLLVWFIRRYIRRALALERELYGYTSNTSQSSAPHRLSTFMQPIKEGAVDLRALRSSAPAPSSNVPHQLPAPGGSSSPHTAFGFLQKYSLFFFFIALIVAGGITLSLYLGDVLTPERDFEISNISGEAETVVTE